MFRSLEVFEALKEVLLHFTEFLHAFLAAHADV